MRCLPDYTREQWLVIVTFVVVNFCNAMCVSMQAPFYPKEAEKKGCVPSEYGLVFGIFELTVFIVSPIIGANLNRMGVKATLNIGIGTVGVTSILFGLLDKIEDGKVFLGLSFTLRIIEACGNAGFLTGSFSMIAKEFPQNMATMFAVLETFFGLGMIMGPTVGGALFQVGGFTLPFVTLGGVLVAAALFTSVILPRSTVSRERHHEKPSMLQALKIPSILMASYSVACAASSLGFIQATLEPHLRDFDLTPLQIGAFFVICGVCYAVSATAWGMICDKKPPKAVSMIGAVLITVAFSLLGPLPFLHMKKTIPLVVVSLILHGLGLGAGVVAGFADSHKQAIASGLPDTVDTYGLISGLWTSVFALGAFAGPTVAGILFDAVGFPLAALFIIVNHLVVIGLLLVFGISGFARCCHPRPDVGGDEEESNQLVHEDAVGSTSVQYGSTDEGNAEDSREAMRQQRRMRRARKYSEVSSSVARSISLAYPQFLGPGVATSYRNPPPSMSNGAVGGSYYEDVENLYEIMSD